jgi:hypothetical protein
MEGMIVAEVLMSSSIKESETLDDMTLKHYMEMYKNPITKDYDSHYQSYRGGPREEGQEER